MSHEMLIERLFEVLIAGERPASRALVEEARSRGLSPEQIVAEIFWPTYENIERLFRSDQLTPLAHHMATRLLRVLTDQMAARFAQQPRIGRSVFAVCGPTDADELAAQMAVDMLEREGFTMRFAVGGIASDEIQAQVQETAPDVLLLFASAPSDLPAIRGLIDTLNEVGACRGLQIVVGGGVFNRAEGLAEEIGADLWATKPTDLVKAMREQPERRASCEQRTVGRKRKVKAA